MKRVKVIVTIPDMEVHESDEEAIREAVKYTLRDILEGDDAGEEELDFSIEEFDEEFE